MSSPTIGAYQIGVAQLQSWLWQDMEEEDKIAKQVSSLMRKGNTPGIKMTGK